MRDEKEERKKKARSNKQTRQSNTAHPRQSLFLEKCAASGGTRTHDTLYSRQSALPTELPRQLRHVHVPKPAVERSKGSTLGTSMNWTWTWRSLHFVATRHRLKSHTCGGVVSYSTVICILHTCIVTTLL